MSPPSRTRSRVIGLMSLTPAWSWSVPTTPPPPPPVPPPQLASTSAATVASATTATGRERMRMGRFLSLLSHSAPGSHDAVRGGEVAGHLVVGPGPAGSLPAGVIVL